MRKYNNCRFLLPLALLILGLSTVACNKKEDDDDEDSTLNTTLNVAVTSFYLKANKEGTANLDSVFFTIDLDHGVIFNADSLPKGTSIDKVVPVVKYSSYISEATFTMEGGTTRTGTVNYIESPNDSIDFTGNVTLRVAADNGNISKTYRIKVNVHKQDPDNLRWDELAIAELPSRLGKPVNQKTVAKGNHAFTFIEESDGSFTMASSANLFENRWSASTLTLPFRPEIRSLVATESSLFMLADNGMLYESPDGTAWSSTGETWTSIIGTYDGTVIGTKASDNGLIYSQYPHKELISTGIDADFPIEGISNFVTLSNKWTSTPVGFFVGGKKADGKLSPVTWAFDGRAWIKLCEGGIPNVSGMTVVPYYSYRTVSSTVTKMEFNVWLAFGGILENGDMNRTMYISFDNGVSWRKGDSHIQLPDILPALINYDNIVMETAMQANLSDAWKIMKRRTERPRRVAFSTDGDIISWECPYIYLFGGFDASGHLSDSIWRGVLTRLTFAPLF